jgi:hypothetical protein
VSWHRQSLPEEPTIRPNSHTKRLAAVAVITGGAAGVLGAPGPAGADVPASNGTIVMSKCEDGTNCSLGHIWTIDPTSGAERQVTTDASSWDDDPAVSPDGSRVAFQRCPTVGTCRIASVDIGGGVVTDLTAGASYEDYPSFSPDGTRLVFSRNDPNGGVHLIVMDAAGGNEHPLTSGAAADREADWSPDGSAIAFERGESGVTRIHRMPASGGSPVPLSAGPGDRGASFSPDGSQIVFSNDEVIEVMGSSGTGRHALTAPTAGMRDGQPAFAPDGTQIVFQRYDPAAHVSPLLVMNADGSSEHLISGPSEVLFRADWQPVHPAPATAPAPVPGAGASHVAARDDSAPGLTLGAPSRESVRKGRLYLFATSSEPATGDASGKVAAVLGKRKRLRHTSTALSANTRTRIRLSIPRQRLRAIRAALGRHEKLTARIVVRVSDGAGNVTTKSRAIRLKK